jgi:uncharacterized membrane-anchored protein YhcB (DUF1043 family)
VRPWLAALSGLVVGGATCAVILRARSQELAERGQLLQASLVEGGDDLRTYFLGRREEVERRIGQIAQQTAEPIARQTASEYLGAVYGLTPDRVRRLRTLSETWN